ncbi:hypothetical protein EV368DRAFT_90022 [Lentinula lateritia]|nr:hypothetical protein EV368DRAFT_90022 [Lentinula lateritia]
MSLSVRLPEFLRDGLEQQWGIPPEHRSSPSSTPVFGHFPTIPIPFCLRFREGSAMMRLAPSMDLDPFVSLGGRIQVPLRLVKRNQEIESLKEVEKGSADEGASSRVGGSIPMGLDLPMLESLAEPTLES